MIRPSPDLPLLETSPTAVARAVPFLVLLIVAAPLSFLLFLINGYRKGSGYLQQWFALGLALAMIVVGVGMLIFRRRMLANSPARTLLLLLAGAGLLVAAAVVWNQVFTGYIRSSRIYCDIFRGSFRNNLRSPMYGKPQLVADSSFLLPVLTGLALVAIVIWNARRRPAEPLASRWLLPGLIVFQIAITLGLALVESPDRVRTHFSSYWIFAEDLAHFTGVSDILRNYVQRMPDLGRYGQHYPPGILVLFQIAEGLHFPRLVQIVGVLLPALTLLPLCGLARELKLSPSASGAALLLFATAANVLIFPTLSPTAALMLFPALCVWMLVRALNRDSIAAAGLMGGCFAAYVFFTFASYMVVAVMGLIVLTSVVARHVPLRRAVKVVAVSVIAFVAVFAVVWLVTGFNVVGCFRMASTLHLRQTSHGFDHPLRYVLRSTGGLIAYLLASGFSLTILGCAALGSARSLRQQNPALRAFIWAVALGILAGAFSGMSFLETERIWLFYSAPLAVLAGYELDRRRRAEGNTTLVGVVMLAVVFVWSYGLPFQHHLWRSELEESPSRSTTQPATRPAKTKAGKAVPVRTRPAAATNPVPSGNDR